MKKSPKVTVGITSYNEADYISETLDNIISQGYDDLEILVHDNHSDDGTVGIVEEYAERYPFVSCTVHNRNIGALQNYNSLVKKASGEYFLFGGAHDKWSDCYIEKLVSTLEGNSTAVLAYGRTLWIYEDGELMPKNTSLVDTSGFSAPVRFALTSLGNQHAMYGMIRLDALRQTRLQLQILGSGAVMLGELALLGEFLVAPDVIWYRRQNRKVETHEQRISRYSNMLFSKKKKMLLPHWRIPLEFFAAIMISNISIKSKVITFFFWPITALIYGTSMIYDLKCFLKNLFSL